MMLRHRCLSAPLGQNNKQHGTLSRPPLHPTPTSRGLSRRSLHVVCFRPNDNSSSSSSGLYSRQQSKTHNPSSNSTIYLAGISHHTLLGVQPGASQEAIRASYEDRVLAQTQVGGAAVTHSSQSVNLTLTMLPALTSHP